MRRPHVLALVALVGVIFVVISALLARVFSADGAERSAVTSLVEAEARGDLAAALSRVEGCGSDAACRARVAQDVAALKRPGAVSVLQLEPSTSFSLGSTLGNARVAFRIGDSGAIVQCVRVRRSGNVLSGLRIELLGVSGPLRGDAACGSTGL